MLPPPLSQVELSKKVRESFKILGEGGLLLVESDYAFTLKNLLGAFSKYCENFVDRSTANLQSP